MASRTLTKLVSNKHPVHLVQQQLRNPVKQFSSPASLVLLKFEKVGAQKNVGLITLNRPQVLNALCSNLMLEVGKVISKLEDDTTIGAIVITGNQKAFAAGADIKELKDGTYSKCVTKKYLGHWNRIADCSKPVIAAVNGYALGGGCELAMMCDIIYAGENATFGQPEILVGTIPGSGGTQRLPRYIGKSKAMELILTGNKINATEAERIGLVSKVFPDAEVVNEAVKLGEKISANSPLIVSMAKEAVNTAYETTLREGLRFEKKCFYGTFATSDRKEGMTAFFEKRPPKFTSE